MDWAGFGPNGPVMQEVRGSRRKEGKKRAKHQRDRTCGVWLCWRDRPSGTALWSSRCSSVPGLLLPIPSIPAARSFLVTGRAVAVPGALNPDHALPSAVGRGCLPRAGAGGRQKTHPRSSGRRKAGSGEDGGEMTGVHCCHARQ